MRGMQAEELARVRFRGTHRVTVVPSPTGELILLEGTSCTVLDDELEQTAAFEVGALGHDLTVIALDGAIHTQNVRGAARFISARTSGRTYL